MGESVTPGPLGGIPATTTVYTAAQTEALFATVSADLSGVIEGVTESGWQTISDILSGAENVATKDYVDGLISTSNYTQNIELNMSGTYCGTCGVYYSDIYSGHHRLLDDTLFPSGESWDSMSSGLGNLMDLEVGIINEFHNNIAEFTSGLSMAKSGGLLAYDACGLIAEMLNQSGSGNVPVYIPSGSSFCEEVLSCVTDNNALADICSGLRKNGCFSGLVTEEKLSEYGFVTSEDLCGISNALSGLNTAISGLNGATCGISEALSELRSGVVADVVAAVIEAIDAEALKTEDPVRQAKFIAAKEKEQNIEPGVNAARFDAANAAVQEVAGALDGLSDALSNDDPGSVDSIAEAAEAAEAESISGADETEAAAEDAATAAASESVEVTNIHFL